jgi:hypothetical protein
MVPSMESNIKNISKGRNGIQKKKIPSLLQKPFLNEENKFGDERKQDKIADIMKFCTTIKLLTTKDSNEGMDQVTAKCSR